MADSGRRHQDGAAGDSEHEPLEAPLERARRIMAGMARSEKDARWLGIRMENFTKLQGRQISEPREFWLE